jgi:sugar transferase EpsL
MRARIFIGSPILFRQERPGCGAKPFGVLELWAMTDARDPGGRLSPDAARFEPWS